MERKVRQIVFFAMNPAFVPKFWRILPPVTVKTQYPVNVSRTLIWSNPESREKTLPDPEFRLTAGYFRQFFN